MATFNNHIEQAKRNLAFLQEVNSTNTKNWDWQITIAFYSAVHTVNAHLATVGNLHYRTHADVKNALNPHNSTALCKIPEEVYLAYTKLEGLSRRVRYLCHDQPSNHSSDQFLTYDKHFAKAIKNLDILLDFFNRLYNLNIGSIGIKCLELNNNTPLKIFSIIK